MRERRYVDLADEFAYALARREWDRAYAMTSSHLQAQQTLEQFREIHAQARRDYGAPMQVDVHLGPQDLQEANRAADGVPEFLPAGAARGWVYADMAVDMDSAGTVFRYYRCSVLIVADGGAEKVGWVTYAWGESTP